MIPVSSPVIERSDLAGQGANAISARREMDARGLTAAIEQYGMVYPILERIGYGPRDEEVYRVLDVVARCERWMTLDRSEPATERERSVWMVRRYDSLADAERALCEGVADPLAGWSHGARGACHDSATNVSYPWHEPWVPSRASRDTCVRCGQFEPRIGHHKPFADR